MSERLVKWQQAGIRFSSKTLLKTIGLCDQNGRKREEIRSFAGHPLIFRDKLLGGYRCLQPPTLGQPEFTWLGLFANQAAVAIANARAEEALQSSERNLSAIIDTIPTLAWCNLPDGSNEFLNKGWHEYTGLSPEESHGLGLASCFPSGRICRH
jgi:GAF domain-containing protein